MSLTVPNNANVTMTATSAFQHLCPFVDEVDNGTITIAWEVDGATFELHALAEYLRVFKDSRISHEEITDRIHHDLSTIPGIRLLAATTRWETAGMEVQCSTSPTLAEQL